MGYAIRQISITHIISFLLPYICMYVCMCYVCMYVCVSNCLKGWVQSTMPSLGAHSTKQCWVSGMQVVCLTDRALLVESVHFPVQRASPSFLHWYCLLFHRSWTRIDLPVQAELLADSRDYLHLLVCRFNSLIIQESEKIEGFSYAVRSSRVNQVSWRVL